MKIKIDFNETEEEIKILWNFNEKVVNAEMLAKQILNDKGLPESYESDILDQIEQ